MSDSRGHGRRNGVDCGCVPPRNTASQAASTGTSAAAAGVVYQGEVTHRDARICRTSLDRWPVGFGAISESVKAAGDRSGHLGHRQELSYVT